MWFPIDVIKLLWVRIFVAVEGEFINSILHENLAYINKWPTTHEAQIFAWKTPKVKNHMVLPSLKQFYFIG